MKDGVRYIAIVSGPIGRKRYSKTILVGVIFRENYIEGLLSTQINADGTDSTKQIINMVKRSRFRGQIRILLLNGIALAGLNIIDPNALEKELKSKMVLLNRRKQNPNELIDALNEYSRITKIEVMERVEIVRAYGSVKPLRIKNLFMQSKLEDHYLRKFADNAFESLRIAHIIASGIYTGESKGRL